MNSNLLLLQYIWAKTSWIWYTIAVFWFTLPWLHPIALYLHTYSRLEKCVCFFSSQKKHNDVIEICPMLRFLPSIPSQIVIPYSSFRVSTYCTFWNFKTMMTHGLWCKHLSKAPKWLVIDDNMLSVGGAKCSFTVH